MISPALLLTQYLSFLSYQLKLCRRWLLHTSTHKTNVFRDTKSSPSSNYSMSLFAKITPAHQEQSYSLHLKLTIKYCLVMVATTWTATFQICYHLLHIPISWHKPLLLQNHKDMYFQLVHNFSFTNHYPSPCIQVPTMYSHKSQWLYDQTTYRGIKGLILKWQIKCTDMFLKCSTKETLMKLDRKELMKTRADIYRKNCSCRFGNCDAHNWIGHLLQLHI